MSLTRADLRAQLRSLLHDFPYDKKALALEATATATTFTFASGDEETFKAGFDVEVGTEVCRVTEINTTDHTITVLRGHLGSTAAIHLLGADVFAHNLFTDLELNRLISRAIKSLWPKIWFPVDVTKADLTVADTLDYALDHTHVFRLYIEDGPDSGLFVPLTNVEMRRVLNPVDARYEKTYITFHQQPQYPRDVRYTYAYAVPDLTTDLDTLWAEDYESGLGEAILMLAASQAAFDCVLRRARFHEFSVAVEERVADVDAIIRTRFAYQNAAEVKLAQIARPLPPLWPSRRRRG